MNKKPAYLQIYETMRRELVDGLWPRGSRLPSKRDLADRFGVSVITAEHAYALLAEEGYDIAFSYYPNSQNVEASIETTLSKLHERGAKGLPFPESFLPAATTKSSIAAPNP